MTTLKRREHTHRKRDTHTHTQQEVDKKFAGRMDESGGEREGGIQPAGGIIIILPQKSKINKMKKAPR